jgi:hypothetical protein
VTTLALLLKPSTQPKAIVFFCTKPVGQEGTVSSQHFGEFLHRFDFGSHGSCAPGIKELSGPSGRTVAPEPLKILFEQVGAEPNM